MTVCVDGGMMPARSPVKEKREQEKEGKGEGGEGGVLIGCLP